MAAVFDFGFGFEAGFVGFDGFDDLEVGFLLAGAFEAGFDLLALAAGLREVCLLEGFGFGLFAGFFVADFDFELDFEVGLLLEGLFETGFNLLTLVAGLRGVCLLEDFGAGLVPGFFVADFDFGFDFEVGRLLEALFETGFDLLPLADGLREVCLFEDFEFALFAGFFVATFDFDFDFEAGCLLVGLFEVGFDLLTLAVDLRDVFLLADFEVDLFAGFVTTFDFEFDFAEVLGRLVLADDFGDGFLFDVGFLEAAFEGDF